MSSRWRHAPAFRSAVILSCGILLQDILPFEPVHLLAGSLALCLPLLLLLLFHKPVLPLAGPLLCLAAGVSLAAGDRLVLSPLPDRLLGEEVAVEGTVVEISQRKWGGERLILDDARILAESTFLPVRGSMLVAVAGGSGPDDPEFRTGMKILVQGTLYPIAGPRNPGEYDLRRWARAEGLAGEITARPPDTITVLDSMSDRSLRSRVILPPRRALLGWIDRTVGGEEGELLKGLLIGERTGISPGTQDDFVRAGVAHVLAVSGSNVAVVAAFWGFLLGMTGLGRAARSVLLAALLVGYMLVAGSQPPVVRATIMATVALTSVALGEKVNVLNALGVSALIMLGVNSQTLFDVGFQLSFAAVLSLVVLYPRLDAVISRLRGRRWSTRAVRAGLRVMAVTLAATLGTLPLTAGVFGRVSLVGLVANVIVVPATGLSVLLGGLSALLAPLWESMASLYAAANWAVLRFTLRFTHLCGSPEWASLAMPWFRAEHTLPFLALLYTAFSLRSPSRFRKSLLATLALTVLVGPVTLLRGGGEEGRSLRVTVLDVGQGDATLIDLPGGRHILVDCGPAGPGYDAGERTIVPLLARRGIDTLDWLVVTHEHRDHTGGLRSVLGPICVRELAAPAHLAATLSSEIGREIRPLEMGDTVDLGPAIRCHVLSPSSVPPEGRNAGGNDGSLVLRLQYGSTVLMLAGDAGALVEDALVDRFGGFLRSDCLKVAHHGSASATSDRFLAAVRPSTALISVGRSNRFRHPARVTVEKLRAFGARIRRTDIGGASILRSDGTFFIVER